MKPESSGEYENLYAGAYGAKKKKIVALPHTLLEYSFDIVWNRDGAYDGATESSGNDAM